jgi:heterodisulfide reductase subunit A
LTFTEVDNVKGETGDFKVTLSKKPRYIIEDKCTGCTTCVKYCPVEYPDQFNQEISSNKAVHVYFSQAIPLVAYIDESCLYLKEKKCDICRRVCQADAIDFNQTPEKTEINVGAIILSSGIKPFDPTEIDEYGYGKMQNVVTSMDYERLLSSTGPYEGEVLRASDKKHPKKIAWIQCVGSRRVTPGENSYCSGVCCTYAQKQVILTKDHNAEAECTIFHNDIRSHGKDFERYFQRAEQLPGVQFIRSYVSIEREIPESKNVTIRYATAGDGVKEEEFDLVVLSVGLNPPADSEDLAEMFGIELDSHGFCKAMPSNPMPAINRTAASMSCTRV